MPCCANERHARPWILGLVAAAAANSREYKVCGKDGKPAAGLDTVYFTYFTYYWFGKPDQTAAAVRPVVGKLSATLGKDFLRDSVILKGVKGITASLTFLLAMVRWIRCFDAH